MIGEFVSNHIFMCSILMPAIVGILAQYCMAKVLKDYVKASEQMDTTQKKNLLNLKNQFETIYGLECEVRNPKAYVDKYLVKLRCMGISYVYWDKISYITAGAASVVVAGLLLYGVLNGSALNEIKEIGVTYGLVLSCLFLAHHILGVKSKQEQIEIQLVDYLENYVTNRLVRGKKGKEEGKKERTRDKDAMESTALNTNGEAEGQELNSQVAAAKEAVNEETDADLLEEFVQSFLA